MISRRDVLVATATGAMATAASAQAATFGNPDEPPQGAINATNPASVTDPGPRNPALASQFPSAGSPPATDVGDMPMFWASFNNTPKRIQNGGWARQVTQADFAISETISGVNMRLTAGGIRELHWHLAAEWGFMSNGKLPCYRSRRSRPSLCGRREGRRSLVFSRRPAALAAGARPGRLRVHPRVRRRKGDGVQYPALDGLARPHAAGDLGGELRRSRRCVCENSAAPALDFSGQLPGALEADRAAVKAPDGFPPNPFTFSLGSMPPTRQTKGGEARIADSRNFIVSKTIAAALVTLRPGALRGMHWHPNADEWQYWIKGKGRMTVFNTGPRAATMDFNPGDVGYVKRSNGHYIKNVGDTDLQFLEVFRSPYFADVSLSDWLTHTPPELVAQHLNMDVATIAKFPNNKPEIMPE